MDRRHWNATEKTFDSPSFNISSSDNGISVICISCIEASGRSICEYLKEFYPEKGIPQHIFWVIDGDELIRICPHASIVQTTPPNGDVCHHNILNLDKKERRSFLKSKLTPGTLTNHVFTCNEADIYHSVGVRL